MAHRFVFIADS